MPYKKINTAIFPVAGLGTRFLPITKAGPKEMLPIVDKPLIQYVVEEAVAAGITRLIFVTSSSKRAIEDYFDRNLELESRLEASGKFDELQKVKDILPSNVTTIYVRQPDPKGLGHAVLTAKDIVGNEPFAVLLADDIIDYNNSFCLTEMVKLFQQYQSSIIAVEKIPKNETQKYGIVSVKDKELNQPQPIIGIVEKPLPNVAPSTQAVIGRYILTPAIFNLLENIHEGVGNEIQLTDAIAQLLRYESVMTYPINGKRYDCGNILGLLEATLAFALKRADLREDVKLLFRNMSEHCKSVA